MIDLRAVSKKYQLSGASRVALSDTSLRVGVGDFVWVEGASGSGKSTLLGIAGLLIRPDQGEVLLNGVAMEAASEAERSRARQELIGFVPQAPRLFPDLTARQNVALAMKSPARRVVSDALRRVDLSDRADSKVHVLSGGQQQRVSVARAMASNPKIILADEPSSGLDDINAASIFGLLRDLAESGKSVIVASHDARIRPFASRTFSLNLLIGQSA